MIVRWTMDEADGTLLARADSAVYALYSDETCLLAGSQKGVLSVFDAERKIQCTLKISAAPVFEVAAFKDIIVVLSGDGSLTLLNRHFEVVKRLKLSDKSLRCITETGNGYAVGASDGVIYRLDRDFLPAGSMAIHSESVFALAWDAPRETLISAGRDARLHYSRGEIEVNTIAAHLLHIHSLALHPQGETLISGSMDKSMRLWKTESGELLKVIDFEKFQAHRSSVNKILWFDKNTIISCSDDRTLMCFEIQDEK